MLRLAPASLKRLCLFRAGAGAGAGAAAPSRALAAVRHASDAPSSGPSSPSDGDEGVISIAPPSRYAPAPPPAPATFSTPLQEHLYKLAKHRGPLPVPLFTSLALHHPDHGYYSQSADEIIGSRGDFTTSPEISQVFGELLGVFFAHHHSSIRTTSRTSVSLLELGPGRGTCMKDVLRTMRSLRVPVSSIKLVELGSGMRRRQASELNVVGVSEDEEGRLIKGEIVDEEHGNIEVSWFNSVSALPEADADVVEYTIAQEFFDALPIHSFEVRDGKWAERMVGINWDWKESNDADAEADIGQSGKSIRKGQAFEGVKPAHPVESDGGISNPLSFCLSPSATPAVLTLLKTDKVGTAGEGVEDGTCLELCPEGYALSEKLIDRVSVTSGATLIIDYGPPSSVPTSSLRSFSKHSVVDVLDKPGERDITADVDFRGLKDCAERRVKLTKGNGRVYGPTGQGSFLLNMGIGNRVEAIIDDKKTSREEANNVFDGMVKLVKDMGERFQVLAFCGGEMKGVKGVGGGKPPGF